MATMKFLRTESLSRSFGGLHAVQDVNFSLEKGEIRAIIGPNGAGKTTFVSLLSGRIAATSGSVFFNEEDISALPIHQRVRRGIAYTFQITSIFPNLTVFDNVATAAQNQFSGSNKSINETTQIALERVQLSALAHHKAGALAYGHQRLLEVAMGLALNPLLLILDEPTQGLSEGEIEAFCNLVKEINQTTTVLLIEHNMQVVMTLADQITVLEQGKILAQGSPSEIQKNAAVQAAYLGS